MAYLSLLFIPHSYLLGISLPGGWEWIVLLVLGLLIFGRRLPDVGRSLGRGIIEFKKGIKGIEEEIDEESSKTALPASRSRQELSEPARQETRGSDRPHQEVRKEPVAVDSNQGDE